MNYALLAVASLRSKEALFPLNDPLTPTTLEVACNSADALHAICYVKFEICLGLLKFKFTPQNKNLNLPHLIMHTAAICDIFGFYVIAC